MRAQDMTDQDHSTEQIPEVTLGSETPAPVAEAAPAYQPKGPDQHGWFRGTGRRKAAVARIRLRPAKNGPGSLKIQCSRKKFKAVDEYFSEDRDREDCVAPLKATETEGSLEVVVRATGGGYMGQAQAIRLGLARALRDYDPALEQVLREKGYLTRDAREVERKKYGQPGARRRFQFSKR